MIVARLILVIPLIHAARYLDSSQEEVIRNTRSFEESEIGLGDGIEEEEVSNKAFLSRDETGFTAPLPPRTAVSPSHEPAEIPFDDDDDLPIPIGHDTQEEQELPDTVPQSTTVVPPSTEEATVLPAPTVTPYPPSTRPPLKTVTLAPYKPTYRIPQPLPPAPATPSTVIAPPVFATVAPIPLYPPGYNYQQYNPYSRFYHYYEHYPYYYAKRAYKLRPEIKYTYPYSLQNVVYSYPHRVPYKDIYGVYRLPASGGCGAGGCGGGSGHSRPLSSIEGDNDDVDLENKTDPLDDISLETLERIDKAGKAQDKKEKKNKKNKTNEEIIDDEQFVPIGKDVEKFNRAGEGLEPIGAEDDSLVDDAEKELKEETASEDELKAFEREFASLQPTDEKRGRRRS